LFLVGCIFIINFDGLGSLFARIKDSAVPLVILAFFIWFIVVKRIILDRILEKVGVLWAS
jgi:hypothetical protein